MDFSYSMAANCDETPTVDVWTKWVTEAPPETALKLRQHALMCLAQNVQSQQWGELIGIAERVLRERDIRWD